MRRTKLMKRAALSALSLSIAPAKCIELLATSPIARPSIRPKPYHRKTK